MNRTKKKKTVADIPALIKNWDFEKNGDLRPENVLAHSRRKIGWACDRGHKWEASVDSRSKTGCPFCAGKRPVVGETDLATLHPDLAVEWNYEKNENLYPFEVTAGSARKVFWKCRNGHEWETSIKHRVQGTNCPYCSGKRAIAGINDLATLHPDLISEWSEKNVELKMQNTTVFSNKKLWWKCERGHEWKASPNERIGRGLKCPFCSGSRVIQGESDLATLRPDLAAEWNNDLNGDLKPETFALYSSKKVYWKCEKGHEWMSTISNRSNGNGCPFCSGRKPVVGETDLATLRPDLAKEWHPTKNESKNPESYSVGSTVKVWWVCEKGHEWEARISNRTYLNRNCPYCSGTRAIKGKTDFATLCPDIAKEWHPLKNKIEPDEILPHSEKRFWWICEKGHEWEAPVHSRFDGAGCPYCLGKKPIQGETDAATLFPNLIDEWHKEKNGVLSLSDFTRYSGRKVWWKCNKGHEWQASIGHRGSGENCPYCVGKGRKNIRKGV